MVSLILALTMVAPQYWGSHPLSSYVPALRSEGISFHNVPTDQVILSSSGLGSLPKVEKAQDLAWVLQGDLTRSTTGGLVIDQVQKTITTTDALFAEGLRNDIATRISEMASFFQQNPSGQRLFAQERSLIHMRAQHSDDGSFTPSNEMYPTRYVPAARLLLDFMKQLGPARIAAIKEGEVNFYGNVGTPVVRPYQVPADDLSSFVVNENTLLSHAQDKEFVKDLNSIHFENVLSSAHPQSPSDLKYIFTARKIMGLLQVAVAVYENGEQVGAAGEPFVLRQVEGNQVKAYPDHIIRLPESLSKYWDQPSGSNPAEQLRRNQEFFSRPTVHDPTDPFRSFFLGEIAKSLGAKSYLCWLPDQADFTTFVDKEKINGVYTRVAHMGTILSFLQKVDNVQFKVENGVLLARPEFPGVVQGGTVPRTMLSDIEAEITPNTIDNFFALNHTFLEMDPQSFHDPLLWGCLLDDYNHIGLRVSPVMPGAPDDKIFGAFSEASFGNFDHPVLLRCGPNSAAAKAVWAAICQTGCQNPNGAATALESHEAVAFPDGPATPFEVVVNPVWVNSVIPFRNGTLLSGNDFETPNINDQSPASATQLLGISGKPLEERLNVLKSSKFKFFTTLNLIYKVVGLGGVFHESGASVNHGESRAPVSFDGLPPELQYELLTQDYVR